MRKHLGQWQYLSQVRNRLKAALIVLYNLSHIGNVPLPVRLLHLYLDVSHRADQTKLFFFYVGALEVNDTEVCTDTAGCLSALSEQTRPSGAQPVFLRQLTSADDDSPEKCSF